MSSRSSSSRRGRKRAHLTSASLPPLPTYVALLQDLSLAVEDVQTSDHHPKYELEVRRSSKCACSALCSCRTLAHSLSQSSEEDELPTHWRHVMAFEEYASFYQRLLAAMQHGHFCNAECPWIYSFVRSYFPKRSVFRRDGSARTVASRREALEHCLLTLQTFLLDRKNHTCAVVTTNVAKVVAEFVFGDEQALPAYILELRATFTSSDRSLTAPCSPTASLVSLSDDEMSECEPERCTLCARELIYGPPGSSPDVDPLASPCNATRKSVYTTTLGCGHQFHDECIVPVLNETMCCPTCGFKEIPC